MSETQTPGQGQSEDPFQDAFESQPSEQFMSHAASASQNVMGERKTEEPAGFIARAKEFRENHPISTNLATLSAIALAGGAAVTLAVNEFTQPTATQQTAIEKQQQTDNENAAYADTIKAAIEASYDSKAVIGEFTVPQGGGVLDPSIKAVIGRIGQDAYNERRSGIYEALQTSSFLFNPQPGDAYAVVEIDINPSDSDGPEYVPVEASHIISDSIPSINQ